VLLSEAVAEVRRLAVVGLAKNTGKTVALTTILRELEASGRVVGVTSIGNDGERRDAIDARIEKPAIGLAAGSLVATTDVLLHRSAADVELVRRTPYRTPVGRVVICRMRAAGALEVAGPVAAEDVGAVAEELVALGAERVLIDGALDRRASASPAVADGVVVATGAVLSTNMDEVVRRTRDAVDLLRLPPVADPALRRLARSLSTSTLLSEDAIADPSAGRALVAARAGLPAARQRSDGRPSRARLQRIELPRKLVLDGPAEDVATLLRDQPQTRCAVVKGALCEPFLDGVLRARRGSAFRIVVDDARCVFLTRRSIGFYDARGVAVEALSPIRLVAVTVNPVAPLAHRFDSLRMRELVADAVPDIPTFDLLNPDYAGGPGSLRKPPHGAELVLPPKKRRSP
jgi:hypothetical protein